MLQVLLHEVVDEVNLGAQVPDARAHHDVQEHREQVVHAPHVLVPDSLLHRLTYREQGTSSHLEIKTSSRELDTKRTGKIVKRIIYRPQKCLSGDF